MSTINFTGRQRIPRSQVHVQLNPPDGEGIPSFGANLELESLDLPEDARVYVEAYHKAAFMRFGFGSLGEPETHEDLKLTEFAGEDAVFFRVKVVDESGCRGLLVASCDRVAPLHEGEDRSTAKCLLHVRRTDLGQRVWKLNLNGAWPVLELNARLKDDIQLDSYAVADGEFFALVYPEVVRAVLVHILVASDDWDPGIDDGNWQSLWVEYAQKLPGVAPLSTLGEAPDKDAFLSWIEDAVDAFCRWTSARDRFRRELQRA